MRKILNNISGLLKAVIIGGLIHLTGCDTEKKENILMVSVEPQRALLESITGDKFTVETMLTSGSNPETFEPGMAARRSLDDARAYFITGYLPFEENLKKAISTKVDIVDTSLGIDPIYGTHNHHGHNHTSDMHDHREDADPHIWTSLRNSKVIAKNMYDAVVRLDPDNKEFYTERYLSLDHKLDSLDNEYATLLNSENINRAFAIWHPSLSYFARDYGLEQIAVGYENKEMPAAVLKEVIEDAKGDSVKVLFYQKEFDSRQAKTLNDALGTAMITINPLDYDWQQQFEIIVSALCR